MSQRFALSRRCNQSWEQMKGNDVARFCSHCQKNVHQADHLNGQQVQELVRENGRFCVRYSLNLEPPWAFPKAKTEKGKMVWWKRSGLLLGLSLSALTLSAQTPSASIHGLVRSLSDRKSNQKAHISLVMTNGLRLETNSDPDGRFSLNVKDPGPFRLDVEMKNHEPFSMSGVLREGQDLTVEWIVQREMEIVRMGVAAIAHPATDYVYHYAERRGCPSITNDIQRAALIGDLDLLHDLQERGHDIHETNNFRENALFFALREPEIARYLMDEGVDIQSQSSFGVPLLSYALLTGQPIYLDLLHRGADPNKADNDGRTPMHIAAMGGLKSLIDLVDHGGDVLVNDNQGMGLLHYAAIAPFPIRSDVMTYLINRYSFDINATDQWGETPLMKAALHGSKTSVQILLEAGADIYPRNKWNQNALLLAGFSGEPDVIRLLVQHHADILAVDSEGHAIWDHMSPDLARRVKHALQDVTDIAAQP